MSNLKIAFSKNVLLEAIAIILGIVYTVLYIKLDKSCFIYGIIGSSIYVYLCLKKQIFAETFLQFIYVVLGFFLWYNWENEIKFEISLSQHLMILGASILMIIAVGYFLKNKTESKAPFLDSFTTIFGITGTFLMVGFVHETWLYFIIADIVSIYLYYSRGLKLSVILFTFYLYLSVFAWFKWDIFF